MTSIGKKAGAKITPHPVHPPYPRAILGSPSVKRMFRGYGPWNRRRAVASGRRASVARRVREGLATSTYTPVKTGAGKAVRNGSPGAVARVERARLVTAGGSTRKARAFGRRRARKGRSVQAVLRPEDTSSRAATAADTPLMYPARATAEARIWSHPVPGRHRVRHRRGVGDHANSIPGTPCGHVARAPHPSGNRRKQGNAPYRR